MTLDWVDRAFLARPSAGSVAPEPATEGVEAAVELLPDALVRRLVERVPEQWAILADAIAAEASRGRRVVAITGGSRGEGRSTVAAALGGVLRARGVAAILTTLAPFHLAAEAAMAARRAEVVLVDAGPWFGNGPIRTAALEQAALGCDAVLIVRPADRPPCPAWSRALAAVGLAVIGEAITDVAALDAG